MQPLMLKSLELVTDGTIIDAVEKEIGESEVKILSIIKHREE